MPHIVETILRAKVLLGAVAIGLAITCLSLFWIQNQPPVVQAELRSYDTLFHARGGLVVPNNIVVVGLDSESINWLNNGRAPIPRRYFADAINFLHRAHARAIGIDFLFKSPSTYGPADDRALARAMRRAGNVVLDEEPGTASATNGVQSQVTLTPPIPPLARSARGLGSDVIAVDPDNVTRWVPLVQPGLSTSSGSATSIYSFPVVVAGLALHKPPPTIVRTLPSDTYVNFVGQQRPSVASDLSFHIYPFDSVAQGEDGYRPFRNKIVLIISYYIGAGSTDVHETPVGQMYGGILFANLLNTILNRNAIVPLGGSANNLILLLLGIFTTIAVARFSMLWSTLVAVVAAVGVVLATVLLFEQFRVWMNVITPEITIVLIYAAIMALRFATEERLKRRIKNSFGLYLTPEIVDLIASSPDPERVLDPARRQISVLFVDVRGFTSMSEHMQPEDVIRALDVYLEELTQSVQAKGGMINKYVGDELIGVWNCIRVQEQPDHAMRAVLSGLDMVARMDGINNQLAEKGLPAIRYGIGVNSGEAVVGEMGSSFRKQYDIIGDTVNTGARLCSAAGGGELIIGQATWEMIGDQLVLEETEPLKLKGKSVPLRTFSVLGIKPEDSPAPAVAPATSA